MLFAVVVCRLDWHTNSLAANARTGETSKYLHQQQKGEERIAKPSAARRNCQVSHSNAQGLLKELSRGVLSYFSLVPVSSAAVIGVVTHSGEDRCVTTLITAAKETSLVQNCLLNWRESEKKNSLIRKKNTEEIITNLKGTRIVKVGEAQATLRCASCGVAPLTLLFSLLFLFLKHGLACVGFPDHLKFQRPFFWGIAKTLWAGLVCSISILPFQYMINDFFFHQYTDFWCYWGRASYWISCRRQNCSSKCKTHNLWLAL